MLQSFDLLNAEFTIREMLAGRNPRALSPFRPAELLRSLLVGVLLLVTALTALELRTLDAGSGVAPVPASAPAETQAPL